MTDHTQELQVMIGKSYIWAIAKPHARMLVTVTAVTWNGEEHWIEATDAGGEKKYLNELATFLQSIALD